MPKKELRQGGILIEMRHGLGDCVCTLPLACALRQAFPDAFLAVLVRDTAQEAVFRHSRARVDRFYRWGTHDDFLERAALILTIRRMHYRYGFLGLVTSPWKGRALFRLLGIRHPLGETYQSPWGFPRKYRGAFIERNLALLRPLTEQSFDTVPHLEPPQEKHALWRRKKGAIRIVVNIGGGTGGRKGAPPPKAWPYWRQLVQRLQREKMVEIALLGGVGELPLVDALREELTEENVYDYVGRLDIEESMSLLADATLSLGVDTGMQHIAAALGTATLTLFGPTSPSVCAPRGGDARTLCHALPCSPCIGTSAWYHCQTRACLRQMQVEEVYQVCMKWIKERKKDHEFMD